MRCRSLLFVTVLVVLLAGAAYGEVQVFFSPQGGCAQALIRLARSAQMYLDAACCRFSLDTVADELIAPNQRGVKVRVILERLQGAQREVLHGRGAPVGLYRNALGEEYKSPKQRLL